MAGRPRIHPLLLVDDRERRYRRFAGWLPADARIVWAKSAGHAMGTIKRDRGRVYDGILLDFDLYEQGMSASDHTTNGLDVVNAVIQHIENDVPVLVHSANRAGAREMTAKLEDAGFDVVQVRMGRLTIDVFHRWMAQVRQAYADAE